MTEWAVFRAIFLPAALVELGCFLPAAEEPDVSFLPAPFEAGRGVEGVLALSVCLAWGFICMILRERVGGGGSEKSALVILD